MSAFEVFTWLAITVLIAGSTAVFVWFLLDLGLDAATRPDRRPARRGPRDP
ncbi:MAG: hypothetical protein ACREM1_11395 [Longimicrobiales bacterium]